MKRIFLVAVMLVVSLSSSASSAEMKVGVWINTLTSVNRGNAVSLAELAQRNGIDYYVVRTHRPWVNGKKTKSAEWSSTCNEESFKALLHECHKRNIKVYAWMYTYGNDLSIESAMAKQAIDAGCDGFVLNAETEYTRQERYDNATDLCKELRAYINAHHRRCILAYSTFARADRGQGSQFPYVAFNQYCDQVWTQSYWATFDWEPGQTVRTVDAMFRNKYRNWIKRSNMDGRVRKKIAWVHTGQAYSGVGATEYISPDDLRQFLEAARKAGHKEVNIYTADFMCDEHYEVIGEFTGKKVANVSPYDGLLEGMKPSPEEIATEEIPPQVSGAPIALPPDPDGDHPPFTFWGMWWGLMTFHVPWWATWTANYWFVLFAIIACCSTYAAFGIPYIRERREKVTGAGIVVALLWKVLLAIVFFALVWAITIAIGTGIVFLGLVTYRYFKIHPLKMPRHKR